MFVCPASCYISKLSIWLYDNNMREQIFSICPIRSEPKGGLDTALVPNW